MPLLRTRAPRSGPAIAGDRAGRGNQPGGPTGTDRRGAARNAEPTGGPTGTDQDLRGNRRARRRPRAPASLDEGQSRGAEAGGTRTQPGADRNRSARCWAGRGNQPSDRRDRPARAGQDAEPNPGGPTGTDQDLTGSRRARGGGLGRQPRSTKDRAGRRAGGTTKPTGDPQEPTGCGAGPDAAPNQGRREPTSAGLGGTRKPTGADRNRPGSEQEPTRTAAVASGVGLTDENGAGRRAGQNAETNRGGQEPTGGEAGRTRKPTGARQEPTRIRARADRRAAAAAWAQGRRAGQGDEPTGGGQEPTGAELGGVRNRPGPDRNRPAQSWAGCGNQPGADRNRPESEWERTGQRRRRRAGRDANTDRESTGTDRDPRAVGQGLDSREQSKVAIGCAADS